MFAEINHHYPVKRSVEWNKRLVYVVSTTRLRFIGLPLNMACILPIMLSSAIKWSTAEERLPPRLYWLLILQIQLMTESEVVTSTPIEPTDPGYIGCYADMISDRIMATAVTMTNLTPKVIIHWGFGAESSASGISLMSLCCLLSIVSSRTD